MNKRSASILVLISLLFPLLLVSCFGTDSKEKDVIQYDVSVSFPNGHGSAMINGASSAFQAFPEDAKVSLIFLKDEGFRIDSVVVKKGDSEINLGSILNTDIASMDADYAYEVYISQAPLNSYIISGSVVGGGTLTPTGDQVVTEGGNVTFTFSALTDCRFDSLLIDGVKTAGFESSYTFTNVTAKHTLAVYFSEVITEAMVNTLFDSMMVQLERIADAESMDDVMAENFSKMASGFKSYLSNSDATNMKAGVGYIVSSLANLNSNPKLKEIADSLDVYITELDMYWSDDDMSTRNSSKLFSNAYRKGGIDGLGLALLANSPKMMRSNAQMPSFPTIVTVSKIQELIESEIMPVLDGVLEVVEDVESKNDNTLKLTFDGETFEIDLGEIYLADASLRLLRHTLALFTAYNFDVKTPDGQDIHVVIDKFLKIEDESEHFDRSIFYLSANGDTLFDDKHCYNNNDSEFYSYMYDLMEHNLKSDSPFMKLQRTNHAKMYADIKMVPLKIKDAIAFINNESDAQEDDILKISDIAEITADMKDIALDMEQEGLSQSFTSNFASPTDLADFISEILTGPYTFNETINGVAFDYTIDFSKFYTNPVQDFKSWFPLYTMSGKENCTYTDTSDGWTSFGSSSFYRNAGDSVAIDPSHIASNNGSMVTLNKPFSIEAHRYVDEYFMPFHLVDDAGNTIASTFDEIEEALFDETLFPHFKDYTFNGIFPDMTRARWIKLVQDIDGSL